MSEGESSWMWLLAAALLAAIVLGAGSMLVPRALLRPSLSIFLFFFFCFFLAFNSLSNVPIGLFCEDFCEELVLLLLLCLCSFVSTVLVSACPGVGVNIFEDINKYTRFQRNAAPQCSSAHTNMRYGIATSILLFTKASIYAPAQPAGLPTIISHLSRLPGSV